MVVFITFSLYNPNATNLLASYYPSPPMQINSLDFVDYKGTCYIFGGRKDGSIVVYDGNNTVPYIVLKGHSHNGKYFPQIFGNPLHF